MACSDCRSSCKEWRCCVRFCICSYVYLYGRAYISWCILYFDIDVFCSCCKSHWISYCSFWCSAGFSISFCLYNRFICSGFNHFVVVASGLIWGEFYTSRRMACPDCRSSCKEWRRCIRDSKLHYLILTGSTVFYSVIWIVTYEIVTVICTVVSRDIHRTWFIRSLLHCHSNPWTRIQSRCIHGDYVWGINIACFTCISIFVANYIYQSGNAQCHIIKNSSSIFTCIAAYCSPLYSNIAVIVNPAG